MKNIWSLSMKYAIEPLDDIKKAPAEISANFS